MVIELVSASKLKKDFIKYEKDELEKLSGKECDAYVESLVAELMKDFKNGAIVGNPDADEIVDLIDSYMDFAEKKFSNATAVLLNRKFTYLSNAYFTANINAINHVYDLTLSALTTLISSLISFKIQLNTLLGIYHDNYSNQKLLNDLFFNLSTADDLDVTFEIHEKYLNNKFGVNTDLMIDLDMLIKDTVEKIFELFEKIEKTVDVDEIAADNYFDDLADEIKLSLKNSLSNISDFDKTALINSGYDAALFHQLEIAENEIELINIYFRIKDWFMNLYNGNGFAEISGEIFERLHNDYPDRYDDFDEFMKKQPKYNLKKCEFIKPENELIAF